MILFSSQKKKKKKKIQNQTSAFKYCALWVVTHLFMLYFTSWRVLFGDLASSVIHSGCFINRFMTNWVAWAGTFESEEVKSFNKIMTIPCLSWTQGLHYGMVVKLMIWCMQIASLYGRENQSKAQEKNKDNKTASLEFSSHECSSIYLCW